MKDTADARVGDTLVDPLEKDVVPLPGFQPVKAMLFSSVYPVNAAEFDDLRQALDRLVLNDSSVTVQVESSSALGQGFRCGFLGKLHMEVFHQRLNDEHGRTCFFAGEGWGEGRRISGSLIFFLLLVVVVVVCFRQAVAATFVFFSTDPRHWPSCRCKCGGDARRRREARRRPPKLKHPRRRPPPKAGSRRRKRWVTVAEEAGRARS